MKKTDKDKYRYIKFKDAKYLIQEGDVLLFRGQGIASFFIGGVSSSHYTHTGIVSANIYNERIFWECVEFREWKGGRTIGLERYVKENPFIIDVYRPNSTYNTFEFRDGSFVEISKRYDPRAVTDDMRRLTGLPYGWSRIWRFFKLSTFLRLFKSADQISRDLPNEPVNPVCSTALAYAFANNGFDLMRNKSDDYMQPSDVSRSLFLNYIFTFG